MSGVAIAGGHRRLFRILALIVLALAAVALLQRLIVQPEAAPAAELPLQWGPPDYAEALVVLDRDVTLETSRVAANPGSWMLLEQLALALHARGQLTGSNADLAAALVAADRARAEAPDRSGPVLSRAVVSLSMHRNAVAGEEVARLASYAVQPPPGDLSEGEAILGDVALYQGNYAAALARYRKAEALQPGIGTAVRLADWHRHRGAFGEARSLLEKALVARSETTPWTRASLFLQLGAIELQAGNWKAAEQQFAAADRTFPGWWLAQAHLAQMAAVEGDFGRAEGLYRKAMAGAERPSVMDALAAVLVERGRQDEAAALKVRSRQLWYAYVAAHPEAYADHAFEAALAEGNTARAWQLAALNYRARPYGDGRIGLARAEAARGRNARARAILEELDRTGWRSTEQYKVLAEVCGRLRDRECVDHARAAALALSPRAFDERAGLLHFGNH